MCARDRKRERETDQERERDLDAERQVAEPSGLAVVVVLIEPGFCQTVKGSRLGVEV